MFKVFQMALKALCLCVVSSQVSLAQGMSPILEQSLKLNTNLNTTESIVEFGGIKYRKIELEGQNYYLRLTAIEADKQELQLICDSDHGLLLGAPNKLQGEIKVKRTRVFISALKDACIATDDRGRRAALLNVNLRIGFAIDDSPQELLKSKKVYFIPGITGLGFSGEW